MNLNPVRDSKIPLHLRVPIFLIACVTVVICFKRAYIVPSQGAFLALPMAPAMLVITYTVHAATTYKLPIVEELWAASQYKALAKHLAPYIVFALSEVTTIATVTIPLLRNVSILASISFGAMIYDLVRYKARADEWRLTEGLKSPANVEEDEEETRDL